MRRPDQLVQLDRSLARIDWDPGNREAAAEAADVLAAVGPVRLLNIAEGGMQWATEEQATRKSLEAATWSFFSPGSPDDVILQTPTHVKYFIGGTLNPHDGYLWHDNPYGYKIWAHAWRWRPGGNYADIDHNHRYDNAAAPAGQEPYWMRLLRCDDASLLPSEVWTPSREKWRQPDMDRPVKPGEAWYMSSLDIHSIHQIAGAAISVMVQGPRQRTKSYIFDARTGKIMGEFPDGHSPVVEYVYASSKHQPYLATHDTTGLGDSTAAGQSTPARSARLRALARRVDRGLVRSGIVARH